MAFFKNCTFVSDTIFFLVSDLASHLFTRRQAFSSPTAIVDTEGTISNTKINTQ